MADEPQTPAKGRQHIATFARDKQKPGKYLIRVQGPTADRFAGRDVPVTRMDRSESTETLTTVVWVGTDEASGQPVALYHFAEKPRAEEKVDALPF